MPTVVAYHFPGPDDADRAHAAIDGLAALHLADVRDIARIRWPRESPAPEIDHGANLTGVGALEGAFAGTVIGWLVLQPWLGAVVGAAAGAVIGHAVDVGLDESFITEARAGISPGSSALIVLYADQPSPAVTDAFREAGITPDAASTTITVAQEHRLRDLFHR